VKPLLLVAALCTVTTAAHAEPSNQDLVLAGLAMAPPTYLIGVTLHESMHAVAAKLVGGDVTELHLFPPGIDPHAHVFRFGWTYVTGLQTKADKILFYLAPKLVDAALIGGFAALAFTDGAWPHDRYGALALTVLATGFWVDFSKDVVLFSKNNDVTKIFDLWCFTGWRQIPARLVYAALDVGLGLVVAKGYERTFGDRQMTVPLLSAAF